MKVSGVERCEGPLDEGLGDALRSEGSFELGPLGGDVLDVWTGSSDDGEEALSEWLC
jgi:hypothetical protein